MQFSNAYQHKIVSVEQFCSLIEERPRKHKVIMCHGMFDLVHPGHVRHLFYAKSKADILVVSITADQHAKKGSHRPFVPQDLRAFNLAALEMVDYVIIDDNETPLDNLLDIQPDFFAKGYEYRNLIPETKKEVEVVEGYGGEVIFSPGDVVYSSSAIIESSPPNISIDKLVMLMDAEGITFGHLYNTLNDLSKVTVHVVGDTIIDSITHTTMTGGLNKTPTHSVKLNERVDYLGGAAVVATHLGAAGAEVTFSTVLGTGPLQDFAIKELLNSNINAVTLIDDTRPMTNKNTFVCGDYRLLKVDTVDNHSISDNILSNLTENVNSFDWVNIIVLSDFRHGIFNSRTIPRILAAIRPSTLRVADSQVASRWGNILDFKGFDLITPNEREARFALGDQDTGIRPLAEQLYNKAGCGLLMMKLGERGVLTCRGGLGYPRSFFVVDSFATKVVDAVGAGDAFLAYASLAIKVSDEVTATILGSVAATLECEVEGNKPISNWDVTNRLKFIERLAHP